MSGALPLGATAERRLGRGKSWRGDRSLVVRYGWFIVRVQLRRIGGRTPVARGGVPPPRRGGRRVARAHGGPPDPAEAEGIWTTIWFEEAHNSTAIEGNTLVLKQVERLLTDGVAVGNRELREYMEVRGYASAAQWVYGQAIEPGPWSDAELLTLAEVRHVHAVARGPAWDVEPHHAASERERPGSFREHEIRPFPDGMTPPSWTEVPAAMRDWVDRVNGLLPGERVVVSIAALHNEFERIHPFLDGNGPAGRLLLNLVLVRLGYAPGDHLQARSAPLPAGAAQGRCRRPRAARRDDRPCCARRARGRRPEPAGAHRCAHVGRPERGRVAGGREPGSPARPEGQRWPVAQYQSLGRRVRRLATQASPLTSQRRLASSRPLERGASGIESRTRCALGTTGYGRR